MSEANPTERDPFEIYVRLGDMGMCRSKRDEVVTDLQGYWERAKYLRKRIAELRGPLLAHSSTAAYDAMEHEKKLKAVERKVAKLWKAFDAMPAPVA